MVKLKRAYDPPADKDGYRVLVERLWPRGISKAKLPLDEWAKDVAPSTDLRKWFSHDPSRWNAFKRRYARELQGEPTPEHLKALAKRASRGTVTFVFSSRDPEHNNAVALKEQIERLVRPPRTSAPGRSAEGARRAAGRGPGGRRRVSR